jgi:glycosyltransferase involved in cell wall biosynthesis
VEGQAGDRVTGHVTTPVTTPVLSICIPTYNRARILEESLRTLLPQCAGGPVEICVSNNASTDDTASLEASYPGLRWQTRAQNVGIDRNILATLRMARGRYVLPIGDDEMLVTSGVDSILAALRTEPDLLMLNGWRKGRSHLPRSLQGRSITDLREAFRLLWDKMPLGSFVIAREYAKPRYSDRYLGTHHAYSGAVWDYLLRRPQVRIDCMSCPVVEFRDVAKSWAADAEVILREEIPKWFELIPSYYRDAVAHARLKYQDTWGAPDGRQFLHAARVKMAGWIRRA